VLVWFRFPYDVTAQSCFRHRHTRNDPHTSLRLAWWRGQGFSEYVGGKPGKLFCGYLHNSGGTFINPGTLTSESEWKVGVIQFNVKRAKGAYANVLEKTDL